MGKWSDIKETVYDKVLNSVQKVVVYEPNNEITRNFAIAEANIVMQPIKDEGVLFDYKVVCDAELNNDDVVDDNMFILQLCWKEHEGDEWTVCEFTLSPKGSDICDTGSER